MEDRRQSKFYLIIPRVLFFSFLAIFLLTAVLGLLAIFFGIGDISEKHKNILFFSVIIQVSLCVIALFKSSLNITATGTKWGDVFIHSFRISLLKGIAPLQSIEQRFLQVLVDDFQVNRENGGVHLEVRFSNDVPAIWTDHGKRELKSRYVERSGVNLNELQNRLNGVLITRDEAKYEHDKERCPFRYASGGALPVVTVGETQYYCLIYREVPPVGWNIANGSCDSREELLDPSKAIIRELNEELIIIDPVERIQHFYEKFYDLPDHNLVREHLRKHFPNDLFQNLERKNALTSFGEGPDKLTVTIDGGNKNIVRNCYVNINAIDTSIELDKIAHIKVGEDAIFIDGEIEHYFPTVDIVGAPVGLFKKEELDRQILAGSHRFIPDVFFYNAIRYPCGIKIAPSGIADPVMGKDDIEAELIGRIDNFIIPKRPFRPESLEEFDLRRADGTIYDLCPVTRSIVMRFLAI